jgi:hypothetical protein
MMAACWATCAYACDFFRRSWSSLLRRNTNMYHVCKREGHLGRANKARSEWRGRGTRGTTAGQPRGEVVTNLRRPLCFRHHGLHPSILRRRRPHAADCGVHAAVHCSTERLGGLHFPPGPPRCVPRRVPPLPAFPNRRNDPSARTPFVACAGFASVAFVLGALQYHAPGDLCPNRAVARSRHVRANVAGGVLFVGGMAAILGSRAAAGKTLVPHAVHSIIGTGAVMLVVLQVVLGAQKHLRWSLLPCAPPALHRRLATATLAACFVSTVSGLFHVFNKPDPLENEAYTAYAGTALVVASAAAYWLAAVDANHIDVTLLYSAVPAGSSTV